MRQPEFYAAVFAVIRDEEGKVLMIKRKNTGYLDGWYGLPAWHIEGDERPTHAMKREILEEVWLEIDEQDLKLINVTHRINSDRVVIDFYYEVRYFDGTPQNTEPNKSEWVYWIDWKSEEKIQFKETLNRIEKWETYSEIDFRKLWF